MSKLPLLDGVLRYVDKNNKLFCMPGHKGGKGFLTTSIGRKFIKNMSKVDITEVNGLDNLHKPSGIIKDSLKALSNFYGSKKSYFLVNGSTSGNFIMIFSAFNEGDKVLVERNCHRSVFNAIIMRKLKPIYINSTIDKRLNAPAFIDLDDFSRKIDKNKDAKGIIVTYPNYYGLCSNLEYIIEKAKINKMKVLVDSAHGAHFEVHKDLPKSALQLGADMVVASSHKTLPSLTQTAYLHINNLEDIQSIDFYTSMFLSTSPSYILMCSMDYARFFLEKYGNEAYDKLLNMCRYYREMINTIDGISVLDRNYFIGSSNFFYDIDETRYIMNLDKGYSSYKLLNYLRENNIQAEMNDGSNVILIFSPFNYEDDFRVLYDVLKKCNLEKLKSKEFEILKPHIPNYKFLPFEVLNMGKKSINLEEALGKVSAENIVPYPPGIPILNMGEVIDIETINYIKYYVDNNAEILGLNDGKIKIVK
ncbi:aminotransferase class V-fold PLP-dependent enzyme [Clostridium fermenticellae]|uniref:Aminotransferase class V-fold PLP-dependent enzyme n=1 Tax=Clostridium fermenticellae TaxID=2068654 RepID=A0A386H0K4_9CLOT|nr:aminotransferase class V-fold PLP-dependent enzyme [Clostridium fermenticellae]AYD39103.1 aminotransferase class V-fold PLP-dependent enzyme [Clostridium fermenticellae]